MAKISALKFSPKFFEVVNLLENANVSSGAMMIFENIPMILEHSDASFALLGVLLLIFFVLRIRRIKFNIHILINISLM